MGTIISIIISVLATFLVTWYFTKKQMKKNEISHFSINSYNVGKGLHDEFEKFQISYDKEIIENEVQVIKGGFVNIGNDITNLTGDSDIRMTLPKECTIKEINVKPVSTDNELLVNARIDKEHPNLIHFGINKDFMTDEAFKYTAIIESKSEIKELDKKISFNHRIPNTSNIKDVYIGQQEQRFATKWFSVIFAMIFLFFCFMAFTLLFQQKVQYIITEKDTNKEVYVYITPKSQLYVSDNDFFPFLSSKSLTKEELISDYVASPINEFSWKSTDSINAIATVFMCLLMIIAYSISFSQITKENRIIRALRKYEQKQSVSQTE